jgi:pimeloyl-ACP methyl ester carboxylesterase
MCFMQPAVESATFLGRELSSEQKDVLFDSWGTFLTLRFTAEHRHYCEWLAARGAQPRDPTEMETCYFISKRHELWVKGPFDGDYRLAFESLWTESRRRFLAEWGFPRSNQIRVLCYSPRVAQGCKEGGDCEIIDTDRDPFPWALGQPHVCMPWWWSYGDEERPIEAQIAVPLARDVLLQTTLFRSDMTWVPRAVSVSWPPARGAITPLDC